MAGGQAWKGWGGACAEGKQVTGEDISGYKKDICKRNVGHLPLQTRRNRTDPLAPQSPHPGAPDRNHLKFEDYMGGEKGVAIV